MEQTYEIEILYYATLTVEAESRDEAEEIARDRVSTWQIDGADLSFGSIVEC